MFGKTIVGLGIAHKHQQKTLIITTTTTIRDMWINEINKFFPFKAGIIGGGKYKTDSPIVVGNIQTVRNRIQELSGMFGLVIIDEVHRSPAKTFTDSLNALHARYKVGLSGTMKRKDGMHCVLPDYFGTDKYVGKVENVMLPTVHLWDTGIELNGNEFIPWANKITELYAKEDYRFQLKTLVSAYMDAGHKVLFLNDRRELLDYMHTEFQDTSFIINGIVKDTNVRQDIMKAVAEYEGGICLFATQSIFSEGVSLNELSCVILSTPINNVPLLEQIVGRVMRPATDKLNPVVVDLGLCGNTGRRHRNTRQGVYISKGWKIEQKGKIV